MHKNTKNLVGKRFGRLIVIKMTDKRRSGAHVWLCQCDCGKKREVSTGNLNPLRYGSVKSCGCLKKEILKKQQEITHGMTKTRQYNIWRGMKQRCSNTNDKDYKNYGGRGIKLSTEWTVFDNFWRDMKEKYSNNLTIDRINNNGNYELENCHWISPKEQGNNKRVNKLITLNGKTQTQSQWSKELGIHRCVLAYRLKAGWGVKSSFKTPVKIYKK